ncbi:urease accessory protein [Allocatelliglobosispora scoriae]|uniref:Urease accessory protein UreD n=1 Tax=Allocatelliglobosispora scoriae TaxID=643052 RepID=A0A841BW54_9ACTN|nr:urease accessory protein UreD [Allocatelliglobosispora scoriae]MBB5872384.1 urease accessory protein [Allocatelliglobosispora scoriae]
MQASARVIAEVDDDGITRLVRLRGEPPLLLRETPTVDGSAEVHLVGGAAGPLGGDRLSLRIEVGPRAVLCLRTVAASIALPGRGRDSSLVSVTASVAGGGELRWLPEQLVAAAGCRHHAVNTVELAPGARLLWRDELVCGRWREEPGDAEIATSVTYADRALLRQSLSVGPSTPGWSGPAVLAGAKATGSLLRVDAAMPQQGPVVLGPTAVSMPLAGPARLITATAPDAHTLRSLLDPCSTGMVSRR